MDLHQQQQHLHQRDISMATSAAASTSSLMSQQQQQQQQQHSSLIMGGSGNMQAEDTQLPAQTPGRKRKTVLSPELREVLHMLKSLEAKPAQG